MAEKRLNTRIVLKHGVESSWRSIDQVFIPFKGEVIVYDPDGTHSKARLKIGDGSTTLRKLPFIGEQEMAQTGSATQPVYVDENGTIQAVTHTLGADVPSDAVFTDTKYTMVAGKTSGASSYDLSVKDPYINLVSNGVGENVIQLKSGKNINITTDSSTGKIVTIAFNGTIPTSLPTTNSLTVQTNGSNVFTFNGAYGRTLNLESGDNITLAPDTSGKVVISASVPQVADEKVATSPRNTALGMKYYLTGTSSSTANTKGTLAIDTDVYLDTTAGTLYSNYYRGTRTTLTAPVNDAVETEDIAGETSVDPQIMLKYAGSTQGGGQIKGSHKTMRFTALGSSGTSRTLTLRNAESASPEMDNALTVDVVNADASQASYRVFHSGMSSAIPVNLGGTGATTMDAARDNLGAAAKEHIHGAITANGAIGTTANKAIYTGTNGVLQAGTLPISGGGTGAQTAEAARTSLGAAAKEHTHTMSEITDYEAPTIDLSEYVKKTDVVDALTSDTAGAPLSAKQGKALNESIENVKSNYLPLAGGELESSLVLPALMESEGLLFKDYNNTNAMVGMLSCAQDGSTGIFALTVHEDGGYDYTSVAVAIEATGDVDHLLNLYWNTGSGGNKNAYVYHSKMTSAIPLAQGGTGFNADSTKTAEEQLAELKAYLGITSGSVFAGASADSAGEQGLVPEPAAGDQGAVLAGDGTWQKFERDDNALILMEDGYRYIAGGVVAFKIGSTSYVLPAGVYAGGRPGVVPRFNDDFKVDTSNTDPSTAFLRADGKWATGKAYAATKTELSVTTFGNFFDTSVYGNGTVVYSGSDEGVLIRTKDSSGGESMISARAGFSWTASKNLTNVVVKAITYSSTGSTLTLTIKGDTVVSIVPTDSSDVASADDKIWWSGTLNQGEKIDLLVEPGANRYIRFQVQITCDPLIDSGNDTDQYFVPHYSGDNIASTSTNFSSAFLRADGKWAVPEGGSSGGTNSVFTSTANGLVPATGSQHYSLTSFLTGAGAWVSYETFAGQTSGVRNFVPPYSTNYISGSTSSTTAFLRADGKWAVPAGGSSSSGGTTYSVFSTDTNGLVPGPSASYSTNYDFLTGNGTWQYHPIINSSNATHTYGKFVPPFTAAYQSGTVSQTTAFLRADGQWAVPSGGGSGGSTSVSFSRNTDVADQKSENAIGNLSVDSSSYVIYGPRLTVTNAISSGTLLCILKYGNNNNIPIYAPTIPNIPKITVSSSAPSSPSAGDVWIKPA